MDKPSKWKDYLHMVEFAYNNGSQETLTMRQALYGKGCITPVSWDIPVNKVVLGPEMLQDMEQEIVRIKHN